MRERELNYALQSFATALKSFSKGRAQECVNGRAPRKEKIVGGCLSIKLGWGTELDDGSGSVQVEEVEEEEEKGIWLGTWPQ